MSGCEHEPAHLSVDGGIAILTLDRPRQLNTIDLDMAERLCSLVVELERRAEIAVLIVRGEGRAFSGGGDMAYFAEHLDDIEPCLRRLLSVYHEFVWRLTNLPQLVLTSVHGVAAGAALSLVSLADLCIAAEDARFAPAYAQAGLSPDGGGSCGLVRAVGLARARRILFCENAVSARDALDWGLVSRVVPAQDLDRETRILATRLAAIGATAIAATKQLLNPDGGASLRAHLDMEMEHIIRCMKTEAFKAAAVRFRR